MSKFEIVDTQHVSPPRILIYGTHKIGKSSFAAEAPSPIFIDIEGGLGALKTKAFPRAEDWESVIAQMGWLCENDHPFKTLAVDSLDWMEKLIWARVAKDAKVDTIEDIGYGKGYLAATEYWRQFIGGVNYLRDNKGMGTILIAHAQIIKFDAPDKTQSFDRYQPKLHKSANALIGEAVDIIGFANFETNVVQTDKGFNQKKTTATGNGTRWLHLEERPAYIAGSRFPMPDKIPLAWADFAAAFAAATKKE